MADMLLDQLDADVHALVMSLLSCIVDSPDVFLNHVLHLNGDGETRYIVQKREGCGAVEQGQYSYSTNVAPYLASLGIALEAAPPSPRINRRTGVVIHRPSEAFKFTPSAMQAYRDATHLPDSEIQRRIGQELFGNWRKDPHQHHSTEWDIEALTRRIGISQQQFTENAYILCDLGYATQGRHLESSLENGNLDLTSPKGVAWANAGFPSIGVDGTPVVNVTVNVTLQQVIQEVEGLRISEEDKKRIEQLFRQFEGETKKEIPSYKPLQDLLDMASKVKELVPLLFKFGADHIDDISRMAHHVPGI